MFQRNGANKGARLVSGLTGQLGKGLYIGSGNKTGTAMKHIGQCSMLQRLQTRHETQMRGQCGCHGCNSIIEDQTFAGQNVEVRGGIAKISVMTQMIGTGGVQGQNQYGGQ